VGRGRREDGEERKQIERRKKAIPRKENGSGGVKREGDWRGQEGRRCISATEGGGLRGEKEDGGRKRGYGRKRMGFNEEGEEEGGRRGTGAKGNC